MYTSIETFYPLMGVIALFIIVLIGGVREFIKGKRENKSTDLE